MRLGFVEIPVVDSRGVAIRAESAPPGLVSLAGRARSAGVDVELLPSTHWEPGETSLPRLEQADAVVTWLDAFNWSAALQRVELLSKRGRPLYALGPFLDCFPEQVASAGFQHAGELAFFTPWCWKELPLPDDSALALWPRWEIGISTHEVFGFPLEAQPHPANSPSRQRRSVEELAVWMQSLTDPLGSCRTPLMVADRPSEGWNAAGMGLLGELSIAVLRQHDVAPWLALRISPDDVLDEAVSSSLSLLQVKWLELLPDDMRDGESRQRFAAAVRDIERAGVAANTTVHLLTGAPGEDAHDTVASINYVAGVAAKHGITDMRCEWWYNVPGSPGYLPSEPWERMFVSGAVPWFDESVPASVPGAPPGPAGRIPVNEVFELLQLLNPMLRLRGPSLTHVMEREQAGGAGIRA